MAQADHDLRVDYVEFGATDIERTRQFYERVFGWRFEDYGPDYTSFQDGRLSGGFTRDAPVRPANPLIVIYAARLEEVEAKIRSEGGQWCGRRTSSRAAAASTSRTRAGTSWRCGPTARPMPSRKR